MAELAPYILNNVGELRHVDGNIEAQTENVIENPSCPNSSLLMGQKAIFPTLH